LNKTLLLLLLFLSFGASGAGAQSCLSDSLFTATGSDAQASQGVFMPSSKWLPGQRLRVKFLDGDPAVIAKVKKDAEMWEQYANIDLVFVTAGDAEVRVSFKYKGSWSLVGKRSQVYSSDGEKGYTTNAGASMNFGWFDSSTSDEEIRRTTLHEFGHALGLLHEHQNTNRTFEWNLPVVFNHFMNELGWSREKVQEQVIDRYGKLTEYSNRAYDPYSIMHYQIPAEFTLNHQAVGNNTNLSAGDRSLIREMYPFDTATAGKASDVTFNDIDVEHNIVQGGEKGMKIKVDFTIKNALKQQHRLVAFFYDANGKQLKDANGKFNTQGGNVAVNKFFTPTYEASRYESYTLFMPYSELEVPCGDFKLRFNVDVQKAGVEIAQSGSQYFSFGRCVTVNKLDVTVQNDVTVDGRLGLKIYPAFAIKRAKGKPLRVTAYFYRADGTKLTDKVGKYSATSGRVAAWQDIKPCCDTANYNLGETPNMSLFIPYDELNVSLAERQNLKFYLYLTDDGAKVAESDWKTFAVDQRGRFRLYFENSCDEDASVLLYLKNLDDKWEARGWYSIAPGKNIYLEDTRNRIYYYYASSKNHAWKGEKVFPFKKTNYGFREKTIQDKDWGISKTVLTCEQK
jgi:hypothetical protein